MCTRSTNLGAKSVVSTAVLSTSLAIPNILANSVAPVTTSAVMSVLFGMNCRGSVSVTSLPVSMVAVSPAMGSTHGLGGNVVVVTEMDVPG